MPWSKVYFFPYVVFKLKEKQNFFFFLITRSEIAGVNIVVVKLNLSYATKKF